MGYIEFKDITKKYASGDSEILALNKASFTVEKGELAVILGSSGAGKTTALNILGGMDTATSGTLTVDGRNITALNRRALIEYRRRDIGFVFQFYNLVPNLTALENVELASQVCENAGSPRRTLSSVGLKDRMNNFPAQLSGGEQQRVSIARALAKRPKLLLCDEPTGALDSGTGRLIMDIFHKLNKEQGKTITLITHSNELAEETERILTLKDGLITGCRKGTGRVADT